MFSRTVFVLNNFLVKTWKLTSCLAQLPRRYTELILRPSVWAAADGILAKNSDDELLFGSTKKLCKLRQGFAMANLKVLANEDTLLRTHCCRHQCFPVCRAFARARNICCGHKFCVRDTKNVSDFVQKHFVSSANVSQFVQLKKHHEQQCIRNNVSSFAT